MGKDHRYLLLVDDEENILKALKREFADWAYDHGLDIVTVTRAEDALEALKANGDNTVIVISDLKMPGMRGSDFLLRVRENWPRIVTILLTGYSESQEIVKAVSAGIFSYILKPWDSEYLLSEINKAWDHAELKRLTEAHVKNLESQLKLAGELQKTILKPSVPASDRVEFRVTYRPVPALQCGGDYYDVIPLGNDRYLALLGHVTAYGVRAAMITAILKAVIFPEYVRGGLTSQISPADFLGWLNQRMNFELRQTSGIGISFFAGYLDGKNGFFQYANAGAPHPIILRAGKIAELPVAGSPFSVSNSIMYQDKELTLVSGDVLTFYTGGLLGALPVESDELLGLGSATSGGEKPKEAPLLRPADVFGGIAWNATYHHSVLEKALSLREGADFAEHLTLLTLKMT